MPLGHRYPVNLPTIDELGGCDDSTKQFRLKK